ncbi:TIGR01458 family HAD-type hydrolase [Aliiglaciecola sp. CAU 1673]|uniref:TIGR01458 family HAD-type hydrolase n=1 Tax=Aliiglaciecola sp. CAU 1673 TaxID=3032595 RepID=UPI0023DB2C22|nr:TIGR01458 family HAD-type hydrolase [Aliiglaciecola sp. CAU 1673]MDF2180212.1 TIGR01458 family HAD-type hydrolase [Aliiglaciecola sp. CAU 1673]
MNALLLDINGVLFEDDKPLPGAVEAVARLQQSGMVLRFITNTSQISSGVLLRRLHTMGFEIHEQQLYSAVDTILDYLQQGSLRAFCLVHPNLDELLTPYQAGPEENVDAVIVTDAAERFDYACLDRAFTHLMEGAELVAIGDNRYFRRQGRLHLDAGPFIHALEYAANCKAKMMGKPSPAFFQSVLQSAGVKAHEAMMFGDDVNADINGAINAGLKACLVKTGKYQKGDEQDLSKGALVANNLSGALRLLNI